MTTVIAIIAVLAAVLPLAYVAIAATRKQGELKARADVGDVNLYALAGHVSDLTTRLKQEKERADGLDDLIAEMAVNTPVAGAAERLLRKWASNTAANSDSARRVHPPASADPDALMPVDE